MAPYENYAHTGGGGGNSTVLLCCGDHPGELSSPHWGMLSAATTLQMIRSSGWEMDAFVDAAREDAVGINGCTVVLVQVDIAERSLQLSVLTDWEWKDGMRIVCLVPASQTARTWRLTVNGHASFWTGQQLARGVNILV